MSPRAKQRVVRLMLELLEVIEEELASAQPKAPGAARRVPTVQATELQRAYARRELGLMKPARERGR